MWVGGWDCGLFLLNHPKDMANVFYTHYSHRIGDDASLSDNIVYDIVEDVHTHTLWIGTRVGLSIMKQENPGTFINYKSLHSAYHIPCDGFHWRLCPDDRHETISVCFLFFESGRG